MRVFLALFTAAITLVPLVKADCCDQTDGLSGYCDDGSKSTPCCGNG